MNALLLYTLVDKMLTYLSAGEEDNDSSEDSIPTNTNTFVMWSCGNPMEILEFMMTKCFINLICGLKYPQIYALHKLWNTVFIQHSSKSITFYSHEYVKTRQSMEIDPHDFR